MAVSIVHLGTAGHFCDAAKCLFHLTTHVEGPGGRRRVSTIGMYCPGDWKGGRLPLRVPLGALPERFYETMTFKLKSDGNVADWTELSCDRWRTAEDAEAGHARIVAETAAALEGRPQ